MGASDKMVAKALSFRGRVLRRTRNDMSGTKELYLPCTRKGRQVGLLEGRAGIKVVFCQK